MISLNEITPEMARAELARREREEQGISQDKHSGPFNFGKGLLQGAGQSFGDTGASVLNLGLQGAEHLLKRNLPHVPHPNLLSQAPGSLSESAGRLTGQIAPLLIPGTAGFKGAQLAGKSAPAIAKILSSIGAGAATGFATNEGNRKLGAAVGGVAGALGAGIPGGYKGISNFNSKNVAKNVTERLKGLKQEYSQIFQPTLNQAAESGANQFIKTQKADLNLLKKAGESKFLHSLEKHNANPSINSAHEAQSEINKYINALPKRKDALERDAHKEALKVKNRLLENISQAMQKTERHDLDDIYGQARAGFAKDVGPYLNNSAIRALEEGKLRPKKFADEIVKDEEFMAKMGHLHPELRQRELYNALKKNKIVTGATIAGGALLANKFLPHEISSLLRIR